MMYHKINRQSAQTLTLSFDALLIYVYIESTVCVCIFDQFMTFLLDLVEIF